MSPSTVQDAVSYLTRETTVSSQRPATADVVAALALAEKQSKKAKQRYDYAQLIGTWQLGFVSGTRKVSPARKGAKPSKQLGKGRFLPRWIDITITYGSQAQLLSPTFLSPTLQAPAEPDGDAAVPSADSEALASEAVDIGAVVNRVGLGGISLQLSGPTRYWPKTNTLGFDFVYLQGGIGPVTLYDGAVRGGVEKAKAFADLPLKEQAFFTFFAVEPGYIAARGKGGGLALWTRATRR